MQRFSWTSEVIVHEAAVRHSEDIVHVEISFHYLLAFHLIIPLPTRFMYDTLNTMYGVSMHACV